MFKELGGPCFPLPSYPRSAFIMGIDDAGTEWSPDISSPISVVPNA